MSTHFKIDVSTINLKLKLGNNVSNILWYITNTEKKPYLYTSKTP